LTSAAHHRIILALRALWSVRLLVLLVVAELCLSLNAQTLPLPPRPTNAPTGSQLTNLLWQLPGDECEQWLYAQVISGNVPGWLRTLKPINTSSGGNTATYYVTPDYLAVGSDQDYFLAPMTPLLAQRLADRLNCSLPTRKMVNQIWTNAAVKLNPQPIAPSAEMITVPVFAAHNEMVRTQRNTFTNSQPLGTLVAGDKKDVIISNEITNRPPPPRVVIYGWHYPDGTPIQSLSAVHEETYADYSHGIRLAQINLTVNGSPNTMTNVLASPTLAPLLSDEGIILLPRYTAAALPPSIMIPPRSRSMLPGQHVTFQSLTIGDLPLAYQWLRDGNTLAAETNATLTLTNLQNSDTGWYSVITSNASGVATSRVASLRVKTNHFPTLFADDFETNSMTNWNVLWGAANGVADYTVDFSWDYGATLFTFNGVNALIPPAPNSPDGSSRGVKLTANDNDTNGFAAAVNLYPKHPSFSGNFVLKFDLWINYPGNAVGAGSTGSTEFAQCGLNHLGTNANWPSGAPSDGIWFAVDGEGGTAADYRAYVGSSNGAPTDLSALPANSGLAATNNSAAIFLNLFPATRFESAGAPGKGWVEVELRQFNQQITWLLDGVVVAQRTNASGYINGTIMLGLMDPFSSIANPARDSFALFDNVRVENLAPPTLFQAISRQPDGAITLTLNSALGDSFWLERSTNLLVWEPWLRLAQTNPPATVTDSSAPFATFYRARR
jgi:hypothetical protein